jgi:hypothetical protein
MRTLFAFFLIFGSSPLFANELYTALHFDTSEKVTQHSTDWRSINRCFEISSNEDYSHGSCDSNIHALIKRCLQAYAKKAKVHFIINNNGQRGNPKPKATVQTFNARKNDQGFTYHVFVELEGRILDMDFGKVPKTVGIKEYFTKMYGTDNNKFYSLKSVSADSYLKNYYGSNFTEYEILYDLAFFDGVTPLNEYLRR